MGARADLVADLVARVQGLGLAPVAVWPGDEAAFNEEAAFPSLWVRYAGADFGGLQESGATTYPRTYRLELIVTTADQASPGDGHDAGVGLLDDLEAGLAGQPCGPGLLELAAEGAGEAFLGVYKWTQTWIVTDLNTL